MGRVDAKKLSGEVAERHGLLIREDDPAMALVTMSEIVLEQVLKEAEVRFRSVLSEAEKARKGRNKTYWFGFKRKWGAPEVRSVCSFSGISTPVDCRRES